MKKLILSATSDWIMRLFMVASLLGFFNTTVRASYIQHTGTNFFVIGIYDHAGNPVPIHNDVASLPEMKYYCNTVAVYDHDMDDSFWQQNLTSFTAAYLNAATTNDMCLVDQMWTVNYNGSNNVDNWMCMSPEYPAEYELTVGSSLYNQLTAFSNNPALLMWENQDEVGVNWWNNEVPNPDYMDPTLANYIDDGNFMQKYGGGKPVWVNDGCFFYQNGGNTTLAYCDEWAGGGTAYSQDCYPGSSGGNMDDVKRDMDFINVVSNTEPHFMVLEDYDAGWVYTNRMYMAYTPIIHGANGIWWWGAYQVATNSQIWKSTQIIGSQLKAMQAALTHPSDYYYYNTYSSTWVSSGINTGGYIEMLMVSDASTDYLITANTATTAQTCTINSLTGWRGGNNLWFFCGTGGANQVLGQAISYGPKEVIVYASRKINVPPIITMPAPSSQMCTTGSVASFSVGDISWWPETYQWYFNGNSLAGQTNATLTVNNVQTNNAGNYSLVISNYEGTSTDLANLIVNNAHVITWQTPVVISGASDVATNGMYFGSWAPYDASANAYPVNGVTFQGNSDLPSLTTSGFAAGGPYFSSPATPNANYNNLLQYATFGNTGSGGSAGVSATIDWGGMTPGHTYEVQLWAEDSRNQVTDARWENFTGGAAAGASYGTDSSAPVGYSTPLFSSPVGNPGYYIIGNFVADSAGSEEILLTPWDVNQNDSSAQVNLMQVRDITWIVTPHPAMTQVNLSGTSVVINGTNGTAGLQYSVLTSTNLSLPLSQWTPLTTNTFISGTFSVTNTLSPGAPQSYYALQLH